jgi:hypothetical protein
MQPALAHDGSRGQPDVALSKVTAPQDVAAQVVVLASDEL